MFGLDAARLAWRDRARAFVAEQVLPRTDLDTHGHFPRDLYQQAFDAGFVTAHLPADLGGGGHDLLDLVLAVEEFGYGDLGVATSTFLLTLATGSLLHFGTDAQKARWIRPLTESLRFASHAWTEPQGSTNLVGRPASTVARAVEGGVTLHGVKSTISNANVASMFTVFARDDAGPGGMSCFVVAAGTAGLTTSGPLRKMGQRAADTGHVTLDGVFVPDGDRIGRAGQGGHIGLRTMRASRVCVAAAAVGVARRARDLVITHGHARTTSDGGRLIQQQDYRFQVAQIDAQIETVRALVWRAAHEVDHGLEATRFSSIAKLMGGNLAVDVTNQAMELLGAQGYLEEGVAEKLFRDAKVLQIYEGPQAVQKMLIADTATRPGRVGR